jgi:hypothetical protein
MSRPLLLYLQVTLGLLLSNTTAAQTTTHQAQVCDTDSGSDCHFIDTSVMGGIRFEDYRVTNPAAVQFDPALRLQSLAALGTATAQAFCTANPQATFIVSPPTISFTGATAQISEVSYQSGSTTVVQEFLSFQFNNFTASNGYSSAMFGFKMTRNRGTQSYYVDFRPGNPGLQNVTNLTNEVSYEIDPVGQTATFNGPAPADTQLAGALFGIFLNLATLLEAATYTTQPAASGLPLWTSSDLVALAQQEQTLIEATANPVAAIPPPLNCSYAANGYATCVGTSNMVNLENIVLNWGGEYLGLRTSLSTSVLTNNLLAWANAAAPSIDPNMPATSNGKSNMGAIEYSTMEMSKPIAMLWPTLRADPSLTDTQRAAIDNWLNNTIMPIAFVPGGVNGTYPFTNNWGDFGASVQMADAIRRSDNLMFANAVQEFYATLNQMRSDGSFPLEAERSACSATYTNVVILHLMSMAEMAATQGYNLYAMNVNGVSLETGIEFLLNAYQNPALINQYSQAGGGVCFEGNPGDPADFSTVFNNYVPSVLAWVEPYLARFPFSATAARLRPIVGTNTSLPPFPMWHAYTGLNSTCAFRTSFESNPPNGVQVSKVSGDRQVAAPNQAVPAPLSVKVTDTSGNPLSGVLVSFAIAQGSANLVAPAQTLTNGSGVASATVQMGSVAGPATVTATSLGTPASFVIASSSCDLAFNGVINTVDVQQMVSETLGVQAPANDLNRDGAVNVVDIQIEINSALGANCAAK